jgi:class 3 adenylate cyclase/predicted ATPase
MVDCPVCGAAASDADRFCARCGAALIRRCPGCERDNPPEAVFCRGCGARLAGDVEAGAAPEPLPPAYGARAEVERRQLTVLFCDLVGSTELAAALDPEDLRAVINAYQACCRDAVERFEGHIAKYMGDGLLAYFGYPSANEGDPERAVRAGLSLVDGVRKLVPGSDRQLEARVGIATGLVVVGDLIGAGAAKEEAVVGETPNLAARLQALAEPGSVVIDPRTRRLIGALFDSVDLGEHRIRGLTEPVQVARVLAPLSVDRFEALRASELTPLLGRDQEIALLLERWQQASEGEGHVVVLSGEPGIGKSRVVMELKERLAERRPFVLRCDCLPHYRGSALQVVIDELERAAAIHRDDSTALKREKLERHLAGLGPSGQALTPVLAELLAIPASEHSPALRLPPQRRKARILEALLTRVRELAASEPLLIVFEDVHWIDPTSREFLEQVVDGTHQWQTLVVITQRSDDEPLRFGRANVTALRLSRLSRRQAAAIIGHMTGSKALPAEVLAQIVEQTDGVPLFIEELTKTVLESDRLINRGDRYELAGPLSGLAIPESLQGSLTARLDRLGRAKEVAQVAAVIGREFSYEVLASIAPLPEADLRAALARLVDTELVFRRGEPPDATYTFKHALVQETAYNAVLRERREELHARIARTLAADFPAVLENNPELIAYHYTEAGLDEEAVEFWREAGELAISRSATDEAVAHLTSALRVLAKFPESRDRDRTELGLQVSLGGALIAARSFAATETGRAYERAWQLCQQLGDESQRMPVLFGRWTHHVARAELNEGLAVAGEMLGFAEARKDRAPLLVACRALANTEFFVGDLAAARSHAERVLADYDPARHGVLASLYSADPYVLCAYFLAHSLLRLGYPEQARVHARNALTRARELAHSVTLANALHHDCLFHQLCRDPLVVREQAARLISFAIEHGLPFWQALGQVFHGWALAASRQLDQGMAELVAGIEAYRATEGRLYLPYALTLYADACRETGAVASGLEAIGEAKAVIGATGVRGFKAHVHRVEGQLLLAGRRPEPAAAERCFRAAMTLAQGQGARLSELRAAVNLAALWQDQGRRTEAYDLLAPLYTSFTEGFETADLREAAALLDQLAERRA